MNEQIMDVQMKGRRIKANINSKEMKIVPTFLIYVVQ